MRKISTEDFIERSNLIHNFKYNYSETIYSGNKLNVKIICLLHGIFEQRAGSHLEGYGCKQCGIETRAKNSIGRIPWNKGLTGIYSEEVLAKMSANSKGKLIGDLNPMKNPEIVEKLKRKFEEIGLRIPDSQLSDFQLYKRKVRELTEINYRKYFYIINPNKLQRGLGYDLDHKYSIFQGFKDCIPIHIISNYKNLEILESKLNKAKCGKCSVTIEEIL